MGTAMTAILCASCTKHLTQNSRPNSKAHTHTHTSSTQSKATKLQGSHTLLPPKARRHLHKHPSPNPRLPCTTQSKAPLSPHPPSSAHAPGNPKRWATNQSHNARWLAGETNEMKPKPQPTHRTSRHLENWFGPERTPTTNTHAWLKIWKLHFVSNHNEPVADLPEQAIWQFGSVQIA